MATKKKVTVKKQPIGPQPKPTMKIGMLPNKPSFRPVKTAAATRAIGTTNPNNLPSVKAFKTTNPSNLPSVKKIAGAPRPKRIGLPLDPMKKARKK